MNYLIESPIGVANSIQKAQVKIYEVLNDLFDGEINGYGQCYLTDDVINDSKVRLPKFYYNGEEFKNLLDREESKFFFVVDRFKNDANFDFEATISIYFIVNLKQVKTSIGHRADNEVLADCYEAVSRTALGDFDVYTDIKEVASDFKVLGNGTSVDTMNIQPYFFFKFKTKKTLYDIRQC